MKPEQRLKLCDKLESINDDLLTAFRTKYKAALAAGNWIDTGQVEAHLMEFLQRATPGNTRQTHKQKVDSFLKKNFKFTIQSRKTMRLPRRVRVCFPK